MPKKTTKSKASKAWTPPRPTRGKPTINRSELAKATGFSEPTIDGWISAGCPVAQQGGRGKSYGFHLNQVKAWRAEQDRLKQEAAIAKAAQINANQSSLDLDGGEDRGTDALVRQLSLKDQAAFYEAAIKHVKAGELRGVLLRVEDVRADYALVFKSLAAFLDSLPTAMERAANLDMTTTAMLRRKCDDKRTDLARELMKHGGPDTDTDPALS